LNDAYEKAEITAAIDSLCAVIEARIKVCHPCESEKQFIELLYSSDEVETVRPILPPAPQQNTTTSSGKNLRSTLKSVLERDSSITPSGASGVSVSSDDSAAGDVTSSRGGGRGRGRGRGGGRGGSRGGGRGGRSADDIDSDLTGSGRVSGSRGIGRGAAGRGTIRGTARGTSPTISRGSSRGTISRGAGRGIGRRTTSQRGGQSSEDKSDGTISDDSNETSSNVDGSERMDDFTPVDLPNENKGKKDVRVIPSILSVRSQQKVQKDQPAASSQTIVPNISKPVVTKLLSAE
jgi:hypothetical protein